MILKARQGSQEGAQQRLVPFGRKAFIYEKVDTLALASDDLSCLFNVSKGGPQSGVQFIHAVRFIRVN